ncbi:MAG: PspA/IM30 family protein [Candidatus Melainabacteria bacterium]|nr:PspA/IM30 family protein [Candidatus Melainabacteria bacterium]MBX9673109.1 PspA/IM30 family protein [Candidatus Obscuribacterales bacterium]
MFDRLAQIIRAAFNQILGKAENPAMMLEQTYNDLNNNVIQVRQAVAQAIASEKQLELLMQKNKDQAATWQNRAAMAVQQNNDELARQALQRKQQFAQTAADLEAQYKQQKANTDNLRQRLVELESELNKTNAKKNMLIARDKAAQATMKANEVLSRTSTNGALNVIDRMEQKIQDKEARSAALAELSGDSLEKQFKNFEGQADLEMELMALKGSLGKTSEQDNKILLKETQAEKEPVLLEADNQDVSIDAQEVRELKTND